MLMTVLRRTFARGDSLMVVYERHGIVWAQLEDALIKNAT